MLIEAHTVQIIRPSVKERAEVADKKVIIRVYTRHIIGVVVALTRTASMGAIIRAVVLSRLVRTVGFVTVLAVEAFSGLLATHYSRCYSFANLIFI